MERTRTRFELELFADYFQFYLQDDGTDGDLSAAWTPQAVDRLVAAVPGAVGVGTARNMEVPVVVEVVRAAPREAFDAFDLVNEATLDVQSGRIAIAGATDYLPNAKRIEVAPGRYRARIYYSKLDKINADGLEGEDHYRILLWPNDESIEPRTLHDRRKKA